jgi:glycosyltransferase involved in cell wall biosynthesis
MNDICAMQKTRIAIYQNLLSNRNRRGPDIFFPTFFKLYSSSEFSKYELYYFVKTDDIASLKREYANGEFNVDNIIFLREYHNRFKRQLETLELLWKLLYYRISIFQVLTYSNMFDPLPQLIWLQRLGWIWNIKRAFVITYDGIPTAHKMNYKGRYNLDIKYENLFRRILFDGIYSWYDDFVEWVNTSGVFETKPLVKSIHSRFCDIHKYYPLAKEKKIIWASALVDYKCPEMFIEAIAILKERNEHLLFGWQLCIYGNGPQEETLLKFIQQHNLSQIIRLESGLNNLAPVLNNSMCYVSTQELENFPSLAMNEAMAAGNVIIARNVGRTYLFVEQDKNGYLAPTDDAQGIANCLEQFLSSPHRHADMMRHSRHLCETVHTPENFIREIDLFWSELLA